MATQSPEIMRANEHTHWSLALDCDGCGKTQSGGDPIMVIREMTVICLGCIEWAHPQMDDIYVDGPVARNTTVPGDS